MTLVKPNIQKVRLKEATGSTGLEQESYVHHFKPVIPIALEPSAFLRYWKPICIVCMSLSFCYVIVRSPVPGARTKSHEVTLASLAELPDGSLTSEELAELDSENAPVIYSGSEYQARLEQELGTTVPVVEDPAANAQLIQDSRRLSMLRSRDDSAPSKSRSEDLKSMVKFISGLIAVNRPNIIDCGKVALQIVKLSAKEKVDPFLIAALISVESRFGQSERSSVGALGLMQLMPATAKGVSDPNSKSHPSLTDINTNIQLGISYWKQLMARYRGNMFLALAAYNWGPANVDKNGRNPAHIPGSVSKYARTIMDRHRSWVNHYQNATAGAAQLG